MGEPVDPILRRQFGPSVTGLRVLSVAEEGRRARHRRSRSPLAVEVGLDRRLAALGYRP